MQIPHRAVLRRGAGSSVPGVPANGGQAQGSAKALGRQRGPTLPPYLVISRVVQASSPGSPAQEGVTLPLP